MKEKHFEIKNGDQTIMILDYDVYCKESKKQERIVASFQNGMHMYDPYFIALALYDLPVNILKENESKLNKRKVLQYFRNEVPYSDIIYVLTCGAKFWNDNDLKVNWNAEKTKEFWKNELDELFNECFTLSDLILSLNYLKNDLILKKFGNFVRFLNENEDQLNK